MFLDSLCPRQTEIQMLVPTAASGRQTHFQCPCFQFFLSQLILVPIEGIALRLSLSRCHVALLAVVVTFAVEKGNFVRDRLGGEVNRGHARGR